MGRSNTKIVQSVLPISSMPPLGPQGDKECPNCGKTGDIASAFGYRTMNGRLRAQSYCITCPRSKPAQVEINGGDKTKETAAWQEVRKEMEEITAFAWGDSNASPIPLPPELSVEERASGTTTFAWQALVKWANENGIQKSITDNLLDEVSGKKTSVTTVEAYDKVCGKLIDMMDDPYFIECWKKNREQKPVASEQPPVIHEQKPAKRERKTAQREQDKEDAFEEKRIKVVSTIAMYVDSETLTLDKHWTTCRDCRRAYCRDPKTAGWKQISRTFYYKDEPTEWLCPKCARQEFNEVWSRFQNGKGTLTLHVSFAKDDKYKITFTIAHAKKQIKAIDKNGGDELELAMWKQCVKELEKKEYHGSSHDFNRYHTVVQRLCGWTPYTPPEPIVI